MQEKTSKQWMEFLKPVVVGLCALMSAAAMYLQRTESSSVDSRLTAVEVQVESIQPWRGTPTFPSSVARWRRASERARPAPGRVRHPFY